VARPERISAGDRDLASDRSSSAAEKTGSFAPQAKRVLISGLSGLAVLARIGKYLGLNTYPQRSQAD
jgi:hypothetical protein